MTARVEVLGLGEPMVLLDPAERGGLEGVDSYTMRVAGAELNTLIGLSRLGHEVALVTTVGNDPFGRRIVAALERERVGMAYVGSAEGRTGVYFKERADDERRVYYYRDGSAASSTSPATAVGAVRGSSPQYVVTSGLNLGLGTPGGMRDAVFAFLEEASAAATRVVFDANLRAGIWHGARAAADFARVIPTIDYLFVGSDELAELTDAGADPAALLDAGVTAVFIKHGARGATVVDAGGATFVPAHEAVAVDAIGAGDAFAAGAISGLLRGWGHVESAELGAVLGARAVAGTGDWETLPYADELALREAGVDGVH